MRGSSGFVDSGRQECEASVQGVELPGELAETPAMDRLIQHPRLHLVHHAGQAFHLHDANETGRGMESNPIQSCGFHTTSLWHKLRRNAQSSDSRKLQASKGIFC